MHNGSNLHNGTHLLRRGKPAFRNHSENGEPAQRRHAGPRKTLVLAQAATAEAVLQKADLHEDLKKALRSVNPKVRSAQTHLLQDTFPCQLPLHSKGTLDNTVSMSTQLLIDGEFVDAAGGETFPTEDPRTGDVLLDVAEAQEQDVDSAVQAARKVLYFFNSFWTLY